MHVTTSPRWIALRIPTHEVTLYVAETVAELTQLPGPRVSELPDGILVDVPATAWNEPAASRLFASAEACPDPLYVPDAWTPAVPLYAHQTAAVEFLLDNGGGLLADDMGLGKTRTAAVTAQSFALARRGPVVVLGPRYVRDTWRRELLAIGAIERPEQLAYAEGREPTAAFNFQAPWWFLHYDIAHWWQGMFAAVRRPACAILDELHWCKNGRAKRSKAAAAIAHAAPYRIGLTGTPMANRPAELWWPLTIVSGPYTWGAPSDFRRRYCSAYHDGHGLVDGPPSNVGELRHRLQGTYLRRTFDTAGVELPPLTRRQFDVALDSVDQQRHDEALRALGGARRLLEALQHHSLSEGVLAALTKLRKLVSGAKLPATAALVLDHIEQGENVVVFCWERATVEKIAKAARRVSDSVYAVHGGLPQDERERSVEAFQATGGVLVATLGALREGVTLHRARHLVLHDLDWVPANILQAERRVYRIGQTRPTTVTWVTASDSVDVLLASALVGKVDAAQRTLDISAGVEMADDLGLRDLAGDDPWSSDVDALLDRWTTIDGGDNE